MAEEAASKVRNVYQRINSVMHDCDYLQKKQAQQGKGIKYDDVMAMIRPLLILHGLVMVVRQPSMDQLGAVEGTKQKVYQGYYELDIVNIDNPDDRVTHTTFAHGMDGGDKAPGKAQTYAIKILLVKGFGLETGEDEESRSEKIERMDTVDAHTQAFLAQAIDGDQSLWKSICNAYKIGNLGELPKSKEHEVTARIHAYNEKKKKK
jgi:hypothetical protein